MGTGSESPDIESHQTVLTRVYEDTGGGRAGVTGRGHGQ